MQIEVGDIFQWQDNPQLCGDGAGRIFVVVGVVQRDGVTLPSAIVHTDEGVTEEWGTQTLSKFATRVGAACGDLDPRAAG